MLCPICGLNSNTTSVICSSHMGFIYGSYGEIVAVLEWISNKNYGYSYWRIQKEEPR